MNRQLESFSKSAEGIHVRKELVKMVKSKLYHTASTFSVLDPRGISFVDRQMHYMSQYPTMNYDQYMSNLKIMTRYPR